MKKKSLNELFDHQKQDAKIWRDGKLVKFYTDDLGLEFEKIAFANVAWCSTSGNNYPSEILDQCFSLHTQELLQILSPDIVLLSGKATHKFQEVIIRKKILPKAAIIPTFHFAHRKGKHAGGQESKRVRQEIAKWNSRA